MPDAELYRAWQTFTFTADKGHVREVDLLIATPGGLFLVEIKSHPGTAADHGEALLRRRKAWHYEHEPRPGVSVIGARLQEPASFR